MNSDCKRARSMFMDALYRGLNEPDRQRLNDHFHHCARCRSRYRRMSSTLELMSTRKRQEPDPEFWETYWERLSNRMEAEGVLTPDSGRTTRLSSHMWIYRVAAVLILVGLGVVIGRYSMDSGTQDETAGGTSTTLRATTTSVPVSTVDARTQRFLDRSEIVLLALVNYDPDTEDPSSLSLDRRRTVSQELIHEAKFLKGELKTSQQRKLQELVGDLEMIMLQIAHLEEKQDVPEIELVRSGVDRKGLLLKIKMEQMQFQTAGDSKEPGI